jgi:hypothetical protein
MKTYGGKEANIRALLTLALYGDYVLASNSGLLIIFAN